jgi:MFS transporter, NNP family, nitrate/nitrite transporter
MQGLALGVYGMGNIGTALAAYSAPAIAAFYGWRWAFWVFVVPLVAMAAIFYLLGRDAPRTGPRPSVTAGISLFRQEVMPWVLSLFYFLTFGGFVALGIYLPKLLVDLFGFTQTGAGLRAAGFVVLATISRPAGGWLADRVGGSGARARFRGTAGHGADPQLRTRDLSVHGGRPRQRSALRAR